jgi:cytoskeletal protein RodZ
MMRIIPLIGALSLASLVAACGEDQTAQNAPAANTPAPSHETARAPAATSSPPATTNPSQTATTASPPVSSPLPAPLGNPLERAAGSTAADSAPRTTGSIGPSAGGAEAFRAAVGRSFSGGPVTLRLGADQRFSLRDESGRTVTGRYAQSDGILTFDDAQGETAGARFPMRCRFEPQASGAFRLTEVNGSCPHFNAVTFKPEG